MSKAKILFIEDEMRFQKSVTKVFESEGFEILMAYDGETGLKSAEESRPDLIMLDLIIPKKNGFEVLNDLKANPDLSKIPVLVLTNLEGVQDVEKAMSLGASGYLIKANYTLDDLVLKVKDILKIID